MSQRPNIMSRSGFSLLELAVVLGIVSIIAAFGISLGSGAVKGADRVSAQERLATIKQALDGYAKNNGYLPCPADRALTPTDTNFGIEGRTSTYANPQVTPICSGGSGFTQIGAGAGITFIGAVPVRTLGLPDYYAGDSWGNKLTYAASAPHVGDVNSYAAEDGTLTVRAGDRTGTNYPLTTQRFTASGDIRNNGAGFIQLQNLSGTTSLSVGTIVYVAGQTSSSLNSGSYTVSAIAGSNVTLANSSYTVDESGTVSWVAPGVAATYVVVSHGPDRRGAFQLNGTGQTLACSGNGAPAPCNTAALAGSCNDIENCDDSNSVFYDTTYNDGLIPSTYFDDYIIWGTNALARTTVFNQNGVYSGLYQNCGNNPCAPWCAQCTISLPADGSSLTNAKLCYKVINLATIASTCEAKCVWSGQSTGGIVGNCQ